MKWLELMHSSSKKVSHSRVWASVVLVFILVSLGVDEWRHGLSVQWSELAKWLLGAVTVGYVGGKATDKAPGDDA